MRRLLPLALALAAACGNQTAPGSPADSRPPVLSKLVVNPPRAGLEADVEITFRADEPLSRAEAVVAGNPIPCVLGAEGHVTCGYRTRGSELEGLQTVLVRAVDKAGNASEAQTDLVLDFTAPQVTFTRQPPALSQQRSAVFEFQSDESARFSCALDGAAPVPCLSSASYEGLADGEHRFSLAARDEVGNATTLEAVFVVDATVPETLLDEAPPALTNQNPVTFRFSSDDASASFECSADSAPFAGCSSPLELSLREGTHTFAVRAVDPAGNVDATPANASFTVDLSAPRTAFAPVPDTGAPSRTIAFSADDPAASFECALDHGLFSPCSSPFPLTGLSDGEKLFSVRASDPAGNLEDPPASVTFVVDTTPPVVSISFGPPATSTLASADFLFAADEPATFECSLDGAAFAPCASPQRVEVTTDGAHAFEVQALDAYGNRSLQPAHYGWTVDAFAPVVTFTSAPPEHTNQPAALLTYVANKPGCTLRCSLDGAPPAACFGTSSFSNLADGPHVFGVVATDAQGQVGNSSEARWTVDTVAPVASITHGPAAVSNESPAHFELSADEPGATFECALDREVFAPCVSPVEVPVGEGGHVFSVRAVDAAGNVGPIATHLFETDLTPPPVPAVDQPDPSLVSNTTPTLTWRASSSAVAYLLELSTTEDFSQIAQQAEQAVLYFVPSPLASARYYFRVRARDRSGNLSAWSATRVIEVRSWRFLAPTPQGATLLDVACVDAQRCLFVGEAGVALRTLDGGASFLQASTGATGFLSSVAMLDAANGLAVGADGVIVRTGDGGASWWSVESGTRADLYAVRFAGQTGFAAGASGMVLKSVDGGATWSRATTNVTWAVRDLAVLDAAGQLVVGVGTGGKILRTEDGGSSWTEIGSGASSLLRAVSFVDASLGYAAGDGGTMRKTTDGGRTWGSVDTGNTRTLFGVTFTDAQTGYTVGDSTTALASIRKTSDGGASWANHNSPPGPSLRRIVFVRGTGRAFAIGDGGLVLRSSDSGASFQTAPGFTGGPTQSGQEVRSASFVSGSVGYLVGNSGFAVKTSDGGASFSPLDPSTISGTRDLYGCSFWDATHGWIGGSSSFLLRTVDGQSFEQVSAPISINVRALHFKDATIGLVVGTNGNVLRWNGFSGAFEQLPSPTTKTLRAVKAVSGSRGFIVGDDGTALVYDGSILVSETSGVSADLFGVWAFDSTRAIAVGASGTILRRDAGGWAPVASGTSLVLKDVAFADANRGWIVGDGIVLATTDGGLTWTRQISPTGATLQTASAPSGATVFAAGGSRNVIRSSVGGW